MLVLLAVNAGLHVSDNKYANQAGTALWIGSFLAWYATQGKPHEEYVADELGDNYVKKSWGVPLACGVLGIGAFLGLICLIVIAMFSFGTRLTYNNGELYYTSNVNEAEARKLGEFLATLGYFAEKHVTVQLNKSGATYEVRLVVRPGAESDPLTIERMWLLAKSISALVFSDAPVQVHLCDDVLRTLRVVGP